MARVEYNPLVEAIHGKVGNLVLQDINGVHSARTRVNPRNPRSLVQQQNRQQLANASSMWNQLPDEAKERWALEARRVDGVARHLFISAFTTGGLDPGKLEDRLLLPRSGPPVDSYDLQYSSQDTNEITFGFTQIVRPPSSVTVNLIGMLIRNDTTFSQLYYTFQDIGIAERQGTATFIRIPKPANRSEVNWAAWTVFTYRPSSSVDPTDYFLGSAHVATAPYQE